MKCVWEPESTRCGRSLAITLCLPSTVLLWNMIQWFVFVSFSFHRIFYIFLFSLSIYKDQQPTEICSVKCQIIIYFVTSYHVRRESARIMQWKFDTFFFCAIWNAKYFLWPRQFMSLSRSWLPCLRAFWKAIKTFFGALFVARERLKIIHCNCLPKSYEHKLVTRW